MHSRASLRTLFHECKRLIEKEITERRSRVQSAGSVAATKSCDMLRVDLHKVFHRKCGREQLRGLRLRGAEDNGMLNRQTEKIMASFLQRLP